MRLSAPRAQLYFSVTSGIDTRASLMQVSDQRGTCLVEIPARRVACVSKKASHLVKHGVVGRTRTCA